MAELNTDFYRGEDLYSDGEIEERILEIVSNKRQLEDLSEEEVSYPILYHLSRERENILCWYPFEEGASVLEVGAGCGAITGALCRNAAQVTSVDLSLRRSRINYERHKEYSNLQIYVGNLNDMNFLERFDYVVLNGVFEYALSYTEAASPYEAFLKNQLNYMKEDGKLLLAIENRLGLKYFAGAPEDHTDAFGLGLNRYKGNQTVRTFTKTELSEILKRCGLKYMKFYYPYPDYKLPNEIFTDETLEKNGYGKDYYNYLEGRLELFSESMVAQDLAREGAAGIFANSFLVEAAYHKPQDAVETLYAKINSDRGRAFRILTTVRKEKGVRTVYKKALTEEAKAHLEQMSAQEQKMQNGHCSSLAGVWDGLGIRYSFLTEKSLDEEITETLASGNSGQVLEIVRSLFEQAFTEEKECGEEIYTPRFCQTFGTERLEGSCMCIRPANIDLICANVFRQDGGYKTIDGEWIFDFWIPEAFIIFRTLNELYDTHADLAALMSREELYREFDITESQIPVFLSWNRHFTLGYVGAGQMRRFACDKRFVDLNPNIWQWQNISAGLYEDCGEGFSEERKQLVSQRLNRGRFSLKYKIEDRTKIKALRFDPVEGRVCRCQAFLCLEGERVRLKPINAAATVNGWDEFELADPQYEVDIAYLRGEQIQIEGQIACYDDREALNRIERKRLKLTEENRMLNEQLEYIYATRVWRMRELVKGVLNRIKGGRK